MTGYKEFREGQLPAVKRILECQSTLLVIPTGAGKSLVYQLPTFILTRLPSTHAKRQFTIVVSPTISLMKDQVANLPVGIHGASISSHLQSPKETQQIMQRVRDNKLHLLFVTPERMQNKWFIQSLRRPMGNNEADGDPTITAPPMVSFVCVDEVHCISEWSHNFRSSYLLLKSVVKETLQVPCILGLTGTATRVARKTISDMLEIPSDGVIASGVVRDNLKLMVSRDRNRESGLISLLRSPTYRNLNSIIIYVMRQKEADILVANLRAHTFDAGSYHAGKTSDERERIQNKFMKGKLKILVATVAFGMGVNKADVRAVIHYSLPKSLENYVQEIGRSGRDGRDALCHLFLSVDDYTRLRSLAFADTVDPQAVHSFLLRILVSADDAENDDGDNEGGSTNKGKKRKRDDTKANGGPRRIMINIAEWERDYDMKREVMETLLRYLELDPCRPVQSIQTAQTKLKVFLLKDRQAANASKNSEVTEVLDAIVRCGRKAAQGYDVDVLEVRFFDFVISCFARMG